MLNKYFFTFGCGHLDRYNNSLGQSFCVIYGATPSEARETMQSVRGDKYCTNYLTAEDAGVERFGLTEVYLEDITV